MNRCQKLVALALQKTTVPELAPKTKSTKKRVSSCWDELQNLSQEEDGKKKANRWLKFCQSSSIALENGNNNISANVKILIFNGYYFLPKRPTTGPTEPTTGPT